MGGGPGGKPLFAVLLGTRGRSMGGGGTGSVAFHVTNSEGGKGTKKNKNPGHEDSPGLVKGVGSGESLCPKYADAKTGGRLQKE